MPFTQTLNTAQSLSAQDRIQLNREFTALYDELTDLRTKYAAVLAKLDADAGVTDTNYGTTGALAARRFSPT